MDSLTKEARVIIPHSMLEEKGEETVPLSLLDSAVVKKVVEEMLKSNPLSTPIVDAVVTD